MALVRQIKTVLHVLVLLTVVVTALWMVNTLRQPPAMPVTVLRAPEPPSSHPSSVFGSPETGTYDRVPQIFRSLQENKLEVEDRKRRSHHAPGNSRDGSPVVDIPDSLSSQAVISPPEIKMKVEDHKTNPPREPDNPPAVPEVEKRAPVVPSITSSVPSSVKSEPETRSEGQDHQDTTLLRTPENSPNGWGEFPDWWLRAWPQSGVSGSQHVFVGDKPMFPPCSVSPSGSAYPFVRPQRYISNSKNPCWYDRPKTMKDLHCVPYVYLAGVAKCGTTDLARRLKLHPQVFPGTKKEYHWWERFRFGNADPDEENEDHSGDSKKTVSFREYLRDITGDDIRHLEREIQLNGSSRRIFGDYSPSYFWDPRHWNSLAGNKGCLEPRMIVAQHIYHMYPKAKIILTFRHPTPRLYSRFLSRIHRTSFLKKATVRDFHRYVAQGIRVYMDCFRKWSIRHCAYNMSRYDRSVVRLVEGMYPVFMADWLRVWPRQQMFIMRYEDYGGHENEKLAEIFDFLDLDPMEKSQMDKVMEMDVANSGSKEYDQYGSMLPETKQLLDAFYQPFILQFARILNDPRFLWKDVYQ